MGSRLRLLLTLLALALAGMCATAATSATPLPKLQSASVVGDRVDLTFTGALKPRVGSWVVLVNGKPVAVAATFAGRRVQLRLPAGVYSDDVVRVVGRNLRSSKGLRLRAFDTKPANRSTPGCSEQLGTVVEGNATEGPTDAKTFLSAGRFRFFGVRIEFPGGLPLRTTDPMNLEPLDRIVRDLSYGRSSLSFTNFGAVIRMQKPRGEYAHAGAWSGRRALFAELIANLDPVVDFREYDGVVVSAQLGVIDPSSLAAIAPVGQGIAADGRELRHFLIGDDPSLLAAPLFQLAGLPRQLRNAVGDWDLMTGFLGGGPLARQHLPGLVAWHRRKLGWLGPAEVRCLRDAPLEVTLAPTWRGGGVKALIVPTGATALVLEVRQLQGHDAQRCAHGILPYSVDTTGTAIGVLHRPAACNGPGLQDAAVGQSVRVTGFTGQALTFQVLSIEPDGAYRLRVSR